jgi:hypothetical protein
MREIVEIYIKTREPQLLKQMTTEEVRFVNRPENKPKQAPAPDQKKYKSKFKKFKSKEDE